MNKDLTEGGKPFLLSNQIRRKSRRVSENSVEAAFRAINFPTDMSAMACINVGTELQARLTQSGYIIASKNGLPSFLIESELLDTTSVPYRYFLTIHCVPRCWRELGGEGEMAAVGHPQKHGRQMLWLSGAPGDKA